MLSLTGWFQNCFLRFPALEEIVMSICLGNVMEILSNGEVREKKGRFFNVKPSRSYFFEMSLNRSKPKDI